MYVYKHVILSVTREVLVRGRNNPFPTEESGKTLSKTMKNWWKQQWDMPAKWEEQWANAWELSLIHI